MGTGLFPGAGRWMASSHPWVPTGAPEGPHHTLYLLTLLFHLYSIQDAMLCYIFLSLGTSLKVTFLACHPGATWWLKPTVPTQWLFFPKRPLAFGAGPLSAVVPFCAQETAEQPSWPPAPTCQQPPPHPKSNNQKCLQALSNVPRRRNRPVETNLGNTQGCHQSHRISTPATNRSHLVVCTRYKSVLTHAFFRLLGSLFPTGYPFCWARVS